MCICFLRSKNICNFSCILNLHVNLHLSRSSVAGVELRDLKNGLSCVHVRVSWYTAIFRVSLRGLGFRYVDLAQKISARSKRASDTGSYVLFNFLSAFPKIWKWKVKRQY